MSKTWYPVIDFEKCMECGKCTDKCTHEVYDQKKAPMPIVVKPENCIQGCHGCGNLCPSGAISYVGESTYENGSCGCTCGSGKERKI